MRLVEGLLQDVPVMYNAVVREVRYSPTGVAVSTGDATYNGEPAASLFVKTPSAASWARFWARFWA